MAGDEANPLGGGLGGRLDDSGPAGGQPGAPSPGTSWASTTAVSSFTQTIFKADKALDALINKMNSFTTGVSGGGAAQTGSYTQQHMTFGGQAIPPGPASPITAGQVMNPQQPSNGWSWRHPVRSVLNEQDDAARFAMFQQAGNLAVQGLGRVSSYFSTLENQGFPLHFASGRGGLLTGMGTNQFMDRATGLRGFRDMGDLTSAMMITNRFANPLMSMGSASRLGFIDPTLGMAGAAGVMQQMMSPQVRHALAPFGGGLIAPGGGQRGMMDMLQHLGNAATRGQFGSLSAQSVRETFGVGGQGRASLLSLGVPEEIVNAIMDVGVGGANLGRPLRTQADLKAAGIGSSLLDNELDTQRAKVRREGEVLQSSEGAIRTFQNASEGFAQAVERFVDAVPGVGAIGTVLGHLANPLAAFAGGIAPSILTRMGMGGGGLLGKIGSALGLGGVAGGAGLLGKLAKFGKGGLFGIAGAVGGGVTDSLNIGGEGSFFDRALPGAATGAGIGAGIGSVVPVIGTGLGAGIGGLLGAGAGLLGIGDPVGLGDPGGGNLSPQQAEDIIKSRTSADWQVPGLHPKLKVILAEMMMQNPNLTLTSGHRTYAEQESIYRQRYEPPYPGAPLSAPGWRHVRGAPAAKPGKSNHQSGTAVDLADGTSNRNWLRANAPKWGLSLPMPNVEPWHWELKGAGPGGGSSGAQDGGATAGAGGAGIGLVSGFGGLGVTSTAARITERLGIRNTIDLTGGMPPGNDGAAAPGGGNATYTGDKASLIGLLKSVGFSGEGLRIAYAVAMAESRGNPNAVGPPNNDRWRSRDHGLFQINDHWHAGFIQSQNEYDALSNARYAFQISGGGRNWQPWSAYKNGSYRQFYDAGIGDAVGASSMSSGGGTTTKAMISAGRSVTIHQLTLDVKLEKATDEELRHMARRLKALLEDDDALVRVGKS